jgi:hypothetical protein
MDASEKLDRFSKGVIFEAALASDAAVPDGDGLEMVRSYVCCLGSDCP